MLRDLLTGRLALVTSAGRGNGNAIARGRAEAGAKVIVTDIDRDNAHDMMLPTLRDGAARRILYPAGWR